MAAEEKSYIEKRKKARKIKTRVSSILFALVFMFWGIYYLLQSDLMNLKNIVIEGNEQVESEEIINLSNLVINRNIFKYNLKEIEKDIVSHPYIKESKVQRKLPRTITIEVKERQEYAIIPYMGSYIYIDEENIVLNASDSYIANDHILITGVEFKSFKVGEKIEATNDKGLKVVMDLLKAAKMTSIFEMISEINITEENNIRLITFDGVDVLLGEGKNPAYLMVALDEILVNLYTKNIRNVVIDMRYEGHISVKDRNTWED
ncbi:FtsQ-type POTRA domain-containing protein [Alkaliphilus sp. MSJ-5]|uniref:FtsQ-type POTRA domain-containing protein n=1 Tax=Alkaliphilus flagellatus TaxID=2841507 RepID=A0ABS6G4J8_9FIRM|nr:FtsQ-type POTRA domain-containing protein [Alkaliphilus flagellatus]MBU5677298.1 FtsQ-type POTRA domain-containing protein [Alkaliphilus flagellatus]